MHSQIEEHVVQVVRDEFSGWIRAYPLNKRDTSSVVGNILSFLGPSYDQPSIMVKSDQAIEVRAACKQLGCHLKAPLRIGFHTTVSLNGTSEPCKKLPGLVTCKLDSIL